MEKRILMVFLMGIIMAGAATAQGPIDDAQQEYRVSRDAYLAQRAALIGIQERLAQCTSGCEAAGEQYDQEARLFLISTSAVVLDHLDRLNATLQTHPIADEDLQPELTSAIAGLRAEAEAARELALRSEPPVEGLMQADAAIQSVWMKTERLTRAVTGGIMSHRVWLALNRLESAQTVLVRARNDMAARGADTSRLDTLIEGYKSATRNASDAYDAAEQAGEAYLAAGEGERAAAGQQLQDAALQARLGLAVAVQALQDALGEIRNLTIER